MPDVIRHPEAGRLGAWIPACAGMTDSYTASEFALSGARFPPPPFLFDCSCSRPFPNSPCGPYGYRGFSLMRCCARLWCVFPPERAGTTPLHHHDPLGCRKKRMPRDRCTAHRGRGRLLPQASVEGPPAGEQAEREPLNGLQGPRNGRIKPVSGARPSRCCRTCRAAEMRDHLGTKIGPKSIISPDFPLFRYHFQAHFGYWVPKKYHFLGGSDEKLQ